MSILEQLLNFKLENPGLLAARETNGAEYTAHLLLAELHVELIATLKDSGCSEADIRYAIVSTAPSVSAASTCVTFRQRIVA
ncbi:hypothetical protein [Streptomyces fractus]|uniref:hypothetical protein n=1 Tax=Streptomyces fractus TaxID=641806 RepID=UPI003CF05C75